MLIDNGEEIKHLIEIIKDRNPGKSCGLKCYYIELDWNVCKHVYLVLTNENTAKCYWDKLVAVFLEK